MNDLQKRICRLLFIGLLCLTGLPALGHGVVPNIPAGDREIHFPDIAGYKTLVLDLHTHSVFSDGHVWPTIRVAEAERDGLDGIAITEHLEWQPHLFDIPHPDRNRSFDLASGAAEKLDLLIIRGIEITRNDQAGHMNEVFVKDANALVRQRAAATYLPQHQFASEAQAIEFAKAASMGAFSEAHRVEIDGVAVWAPFTDKGAYLTLAAYELATTQPAVEVLELANGQGAFTFWNHPRFATPDAALGAFHQEHIEAGRLHGVEIANGRRFYENALRLALKHNLTLIGTSDVHNLIDWDYQPEAGGHRPVTLAFAAEKSNEGAKEASFSRRTVVWWQNTLIGRPPELNALLQASLKAKNLVWKGNTLQLTLVNDSDATFQLRNLSDYNVRTQGPIVEVAPNDSTIIAFELAERPQDLQVAFDVMNALVAPHTSATIAFNISVPKE